MFMFLRFFVSVWLPSYCGIAWVAQLETEEHHFNTEALGPRAQGGTGALLEGPGPQGPPRIRVPGQRPLDQGPRTEVLLPRSR